MLDFDNWAGSGAQALEASSRAAHAWRRIQEKPTSVALVRGNQTLDAQTLRLEFTNTTVGSELRGTGGMTGHQTVIAFGLRGHAIEPDTDIRRGDLFAIDGTQFRVISIVTTIGEVQAMCEALS